jgi:outer membrane protein assembly factor BamB
MAAYSPAVVNGLVFVGSNGSGMHALFATTGAPLWRAVPDGVIVGGFAVGNGIVYTDGLYRGPLWALKATTGMTMWTTHVSSIGAPALTNGIVYLRAFDNAKSTLDALAASNGKLLWSTATGMYNTGSPLSSAPVVANGEVYLGSSDGNVYAYGLP